MLRISSSWTFFYKRIFPAIWFGVLFLFFGISLLAGKTPLPVLLVPLGIMAFGYFMMKKLVLDLVDEVWDDGDTLLVRSGGQEERIALADIKNVSYSPFVKPPRVTLAMRRQTAFGDQITFCAPVRFAPWTTSPIIKDLIDRIDRARGKAA
jgi:hypothetical protein